MPQEPTWDESLRPEQYRPVGLDLAIPEQELRIQWADGASSRFTMRFLRENCPCATCRTEREKRTAAPPPAAAPGGLGALPVLSPSQAAAAGATCTGGHLVGNYALQLDWSDGHSTGIYDFRLLRSWRAATDD